MLRFGCIVSRNRKKVVPPFCAPIMIKSGRDCCCTTGTVMRAESTNYSLLLSQLRKFGNSRKTGPSQFISNGSNVDDESRAIANTEPVNSNINHKIRRRTNSVCSFFIKDHRFILYFFLDIQFKSSHTSKERHVVFLFLLAVLLQKANRAICI